MNGREGEGVRILRVVFKEYEGFSSKELECQDALIAVCFNARFLCVILVIKGWCFSRFMSSIVCEQRIAR